MWVRRVDRVFANLHDQLMETRIIVHRIKQLGASHPRWSRLLAAVALVGAAALVLARANPMHLIFFQDHPPSANESFVPATLLMYVALTLLALAGGWNRVVTALVSVAVLVVFCGG